MPKRQYPFEDPGLSLDPPIVCENPTDVAEVWAEDGFRLHVRFFDGTTGVVDLSERLQNNAAGVFASLKDPEAFGRVGIAYGAVTWANGLDLAPDAMYDELKRSGTWVLR